MTEGANVVFDCVGSSQSLSQALAMAGPRATVVLVGMPSRVSIDLAPLWHRELRLIGTYAYGTERLGAQRPGELEPSPKSAPVPEADVPEADVAKADVPKADVPEAEPSTERRRTFDLAFELVQRAGLGSLVSASYPIERYGEALAHAGEAGRRGAVKVVFDLRNRKGRAR